MTKEGFFWQIKTYFFIPNCFPAVETYFCLNIGSRYESDYFLTERALAKAFKMIELNQCFPNTGPRTFYGPPKSFSWSVENILVQNMHYLAKYSSLLNKTDPIKVHCFILSFMVRDSLTLGNNWSKA